MPKIAAVHCRPFPHRRLPQLLVEVETDDGHRGLGEAWWGIPSPDPTVAEDAGFAPIEAAIDKLLAPRCIGRSAADIEGLWFELSDWAARYGDGGIITMALSGIDLALWDLQGKRLGVPVVQLLGGLGAPARPGLRKPSAVPFYRNRHLRVSPRARSGFSRDQAA